MEKNQDSFLGFVNHIKYPVLTEKSVNLYGYRQYTFLVDRCLTKSQIKLVIEKLFDVSVSDVRTAILPKKMKRVNRFVGKKTQYKKAFIKLKEGNLIKELSY